MVFIGALNKTSKFLIQKIRNQDSFGFEPYGIIAEKDENRDDLKYLGSTEDIEQILSQHKIDEVIVTANNGVGDNELFNYMRACQERNITFKVIPSHAEVGAQTLRFDAFAGIPVIEFKGTPLDSWGLVYKRFIDIIGSMIALIILSPVFLIITLIIKFSSKGPVIYKNTRVGNRGNFITLKFRTMSIEHCTGTQYGGSRAESLKWLTLNALAPVVGILLTYFVVIQESAIGPLLAIFAGFFLYLGAADLLPESHHSHPTRWTTVATIAGVVLVYAVVRTLTI